MSTAHCWCAYTVGCDVVLYTEGDTELILYKAQSMLSTNVDRVCCCDDKCQPGCVVEMLAVSGEASGVDVMSKTA